MLRHVNALRAAAESADPAEPDDYPFGFKGLPDAGEEQILAIRAEVNGLRNVQDAVADLAVAEGAHLVLQDPIFSCLAREIITIAQAVIWPTTAGRPGRTSPRLVAVLGDAALRAGHRADDDGQGCWKRAPSRSRSLAPCS